MKPSEKEILDTLRKTTLAYLSESDYAQIEKAVEQKGILNLTGTASILVKSAVQKHEGGGHDQKTHGSWAGNGAGGKNIQDMSASDQKEFIDRMSSAKNGAEQRAIIDEFKGRQKGGAKGKSKGGAKPPTTPEAWGKEEDKLSAKFEREEDVTTSDAQGMAMAEMQRKYGTSWEKLFGVNKANSVKQGDMVSWNSSGGMATGKIVRIVRDGKINVPESSFTIQGTEDDPAALIQLYRDGKPTDTKVGHKVSTLKKA